MFDTHKLNATGFEKMAMYKKAMGDAARAALELIDEGHCWNSDLERRQAFLAHLETAVFFGAKAIAAKPQNHSEVTCY